MSVKDLHVSDFQSVVLEAKGPVLVDFWASWCGPCKAFAPVVEEFAAAHPEIVIGRVNVDEEPELARQYRVMSIPTVMLFRDGAAVNRFVGAQPMEGLEAMLA